MINLVYRIFRKTYNKILDFYCCIYNLFIFAANNVKIGKKNEINGRIKIISQKTSTFKIGNYFKLNSGQRFNPIGRNQISTFFLKENATIKIGNNVGMSSIAIFASKSIIIKNNVMIGGNVCIYDTDFHSLNEKYRNTDLDEINAQSKSVLIENNVFIGAHSIILKGVTIGETSIIGAGSVVTRNIPSGEIWAGNPAKFIKKINNT